MSFDSGVHPSNSHPHHVPEHSQYLGKFPRAPARGVPPPLRMAPLLIALTQCICPFPSIVPVRAALLSCSIRSALLWKPLHTPGVPAVESRAWLRDSPWRGSATTSGFAHSPVDGHVSWSHVLAITNKAAPNICVHVTLRTRFHFSCPYLGVKLPAPRAQVCLIL